MKPIFLIKGKSAGISDFDFLAGYDYQRNLFLPIFRLNVNYFEDAWIIFMITLQRVGGCQKIGKIASRDLYVRTAP